ncbi:MAG: hypothetical protein J6K55_11350 [Clostridia bacterium]|nr:hypothetical protein [Clostridia bacterium]
MKLKDMSTEQLADALCEIAPMLEEIGKDKELNENLREIAMKERENGMTALEKGVSLIARVVPALLKTHRGATYNILSVLTGKTVQEIAAQNGMQTIRDAMNSMDAELIGFFM